MLTPRILRRRVRPARDGQNGRDPDDGDRRNAQGAAAADDPPVERLAVDDLHPDDAPGGQRGAELVLPPQPQREADAPRRRPAPPPSTGPRPGPAAYRPASRNGVLVLARRSSPDRISATGTGCPATVTVTCHISPRPAEAPTGRCSSRSVTAPLLRSGAKDHQVVAVDDLAFVRRARARGPARGSSGRAAGSSRRVVVDQSAGDRAAVFVDTGRPDRPPTKSPCTAVMPAGSSDARRSTTASTAPGVEDQPARARRSRAPATAAGCRARRPVGWKQVPTALPRERGSRRPAPRRAPPGRPRRRGDPRGLDLGRHAASADAGRPARPTRTPARSCVAAHLGAPSSARRGAGRPSYSPSTSESSTSRSRVHEVGDQGGQPVVVAEADLVGGDGVVLVDDRHDAELEQPVEGALGVAVVGAPASRRRR